MTKKILLQLLLATGFTAFAQNVAIPDANFKTYLTGNTSINTDGDTEISVAEAQAYTGDLIITSLSISDLTGIEQFINITRLDCYSNNLTKLDVSANNKLTRLHCANNQLTKLDVSAIPTLTEVHCQNNQLVELNLANGNNANFVYMKSYDNSNLSCIQIDSGYTPSYTNAGQYSIGWTRDSQSSYSSDCNYYPIHVKADATGANDGSSWEDAYSTIQQALVVSNVNSRIWVARGTYKPTSQNTPLTIDKTVSIYGGFDGTETELSDRDVTKINTDNATIITGDMLGDDIFGDLTSNKTDNADRLILIDAVDVDIDGFVLQNIYDNTSNAHSEDNGIIYSKYSGAATWIENLTISNTIIKNNYSNDYLIKGIGLKDNFTLKNVSFINNKSVGQSIILLHALTSNSIQAIFSNVLFADNETKFGVINAYRPGGTIQHLFLDLYNTTFIHNNVVNTSNTSYGQCITMHSSVYARGVVNVNNSVFFKNTLNGVYADRDISNGDTGYNVNVLNSIIITSNNFGSTGVISVTNAQSLDPSVDNLNLDSNYKPTAASNYMLDQGDNTLYDTTTFGNYDLAGNARIVNTIIDLGAYEFDSATLGSNDVVLLEDTINLYPNPVSNTLFINSEKEITKYAIYETTGKLLIKSVLKTKSINVSNLASGLYMIQLFNNNKSVVKKIIKE